jgi:hypothetical protein
VASIAPDDALILPHRANPRRIEFSGTTREAHEETSDRMKSALVGILILILVICGAVKSRSTENLVASAAAAAEPKPHERGNEANRRLMALSEEDRRSVFLKILALAKEHCVEITRTFYQQPAKQWNVRCRGGPSYVIKVEAPNGGN